MTTLTLPITAAAPFVGEKIADVFGFTYGYSLPSHALGSFYTVAQVLWEDPGHYTVRSTNGNLHIIHKDRAEDYLRNL